MSEINLYLGDCMEAMKYMDDNAYDLAIVDPPYGIGKPSGTISKGRNKNKYNNFNDTPEIVKRNIVPRVKEVIRISKATIMTPGPICMCYYPNPTAFGVFYQPATMGMNKWGRNDAQPIFYYGTDPDSGKKIKFNSIKVTNANTDISFHPCPKPIKAWQFLIMKGLGENGKSVIDPFGGSFTSALICHSLDFDLDLWEIDEDYYKAGKKRYENHIKQLKLF